ncbi:hypothetical protein [Intestinicryptomonas porci]|uniref:Hydrogenase nickel incorporation protein HypA n=1 Tax=Intestinicryptomonas porci TaxID=2926320 RepID=A0ABU4WDI9_9BACT|nr:hypothetical protein [Opitutales bacterium CLA-KB-P66]
MTIYFTTVACVVLAAAAISAFLADRAYVGSYRKRMRENVYHCLKCRSIYTSRAAGESAVCPVCGYRNGRIKF